MLIQGRIHVGCINYPDGSVHMSVCNIEIKWCDIGMFSKKGISNLRLHLRIETLLVPIEQIVI